MLRLAGATIAGIVSWIVIATCINLILRHGWPNYAAVEKAMVFTLPMKLARLSESAISSLVSGAVAARIGRSPRASLAPGVILLLLFIPLHYAIWPTFPVWYHLTFLSSLPLLSALGGTLVRIHLRAHPAFSEG